MFINGNVIVHAKRASLSLHRPPKAAGVLLEPILQPLLSGASDLHQCLGCIPRVHNLQSEILCAAQPQDTADHRVSRGCAAVKTHACANPPGCNEHGTHPRFQDKVLPAPILVRTLRVFSPRVVAPGQLQTEL